MGPVGDREGETFCEFKQTGTKKTPLKTKPGLDRVTVCSKSSHLAGVFDMDVVDEFTEQPEIFFTACFQQRLFLIILHLCTEKKKKKKKEDNDFDSLL